MKQGHNTDPPTIKREYYKQLYSHKFGKWEEMDKFLKTTNYENSSEMKEIIWIGL